MNLDKPMTLEEHKKRQKRRNEELECLLKLMECQDPEKVKPYYEWYDDDYDKGNRRQPKHKPTNFTAPKKKRKKNKKTHRL